MNGVAPTPQPAQLFGFLVPGAAVRTDFTPADPTGLKHTVTLTHVNASAIPEVVFFLLPGANLPPQYGALVYWQAASASNNPTGFELLGSVTGDRPSGVFRTGWGEDETIRSTPGTVTITLGVSIEPIESIRNLSIGSRGVEDRMYIARKIATDLFNYLQSFDDVMQDSGIMTVPTNVFERWIKRFEMKFRRDPNFFMKPPDS
mmetsp:Transcript_21496/g.32876  ORF Transcript_21496/g.32876 Transcript_21496/m.32876 type:complete len:203 (+) Transcript_21496:417-1025(+)|eukprot:CAMPEP_0118673504 /NCGR_PEP_ID=MMETSP0800-20121206/360_1 /TAXON_ID=210618 ORGANISM="Striatella unipunctata, Strain CCMP2910" /NCGR_SAMPLE_ID=MMETSP0800 /ASSEMBLY_ACC=CAM_ASM_000638 /LENGTH=202 /DNA_ID=CAMNT_0006568577 /DNA_START=396 /DNA_END=1004 /DNA_ORIENTATION=-